MTDENPSPGGKFAEALAAFQAEAPTVPKNKTANAGSYSYSYADLADIAEVAYPILAKHGLAFTAAPRGSELIGKLVHTSGEGEWGSLQIGGRDMQAIGSAITYARRYLFGSLTGLVTDADDDGQAASKPRAAKKTPRQQQQAEPERQAAPLGGRTEKQGNMLRVQMGQAGLTDRDHALAYFSRLIGRKIESTKDLTVDEASKAIDALVDANKRGVNPVTGEQKNRGGEDPWGAQ